MAAIGAFYEGPGLAQAILQNVFGHVTFIEMRHWIWDMGNMGHMGHIGNIVDGCSIMYGIMYDMV